MAVYISDAIKEGSPEMDLLIEQISGMSEVRNVVLITKDSAWKRFSEIHGQEMLESVDQNPLPSTLELFLSGTQIQHCHTGPAAENPADRGSGECQIPREWIDLIERFRWYFFTSAAVIALIMAFVLHFMTISNTIKLTIYARKELVQNMHLVGATKTFINMPFLLEGMLQGLIGGLICIAALFFVKVSLVRVTLLWGPESLPLIILAIGVFFGWIGSLSAVRKFLA